MDGCRWPADPAVSLGFDSFESQAVAVSADGSTILGYGGFGFDRRPLRWTAATGPQVLGDIPGGDCAGVAYAVTADGSVIVGYSDYAASPASRWTAGGDAAPPGARIDSNIAYAVSSGGEYTWPAWSPIRPRSGGRAFPVARSPWLLRRRAPAARGSVFRGTEGGGGVSSRRRPCSSRRSTGRGPAACSGSRMCSWPRAWR